MVLLTWVGGVVLCLSRSHSALAALLAVFMVNLTENEDITIYYNTNIYRSL